jgi:hypothetical protein
MNPWVSPKLAPGINTLHLIVGDVLAKTLVLEAVYGDCTEGWSRLEPRMYAVVVGSPNRVRSEPKKGDNIIVQLPAGTIVGVREGPVCADGLVFWEVESGSIPLETGGGTYPLGTGWTAEGDGIEYFLEQTQPPG